MFQLVCDPGGGRASKCGENSPGHSPTTLTFFLTRQSGDRPKTFSPYTSVDTSKLQTEF